MDEALGVGGVGHGGDHPAHPVEAVGGDFTGGAGQIGRGALDVGVERHHGVESIGGVGDPLHSADVFRHVRPHLDEGHEVVAVDADGAVSALHALVAVAGVGVEGSPLIVGGQHILHILRGQLPLRHHAPGQVVRAGAVVGGRAVPDPGVGVEVAEHEPCAGGVVNVVGVVVAAEGVTRVQTAIQREVEVIVPDELPQVGRAEMILLCAESVVEVEGVDAQLVRHDHIGVIRHTAGHPVVAADGLQPPDLVHILESDAVHLIGAVLFQQLAQTEHALAGRVDVGQDEVNNILFADAAGDFRLAVSGGLIDHQRVCAQNAGVGGDRLGGGHADVGGVDARSSPDALPLHGVGHGGHPQGIARQGNFYMRDDRLVNSRVLLRLNDNELFRGEVAGAGIVVPGDHGRAVIRGFFADKDGSTSHSCYPPKFYILYV